jgi:hypothetical protein
MLIKDIEIITVYYNFKSFLINKIPKYELWVKKQIKSQNPQLKVVVMF